MERRFFIDFALILEREHQKKKENEEERPCLKRYCINRKDRMGNTTAHTFYTENTNLMD